MPLMQWTPAMSVGLDELDNDHKVLIKVINDLDANAGNESRRDVVRQCLIARPGATLDDLRRVSSHPVALAQCRRFFTDNPAIKSVTAYDTAGAVRDLMRSGQGSEGAIASALAARLYGAHLLLEGIEDDPQNYTRFLVLAVDPGPPGEASKTSIASLSRFFLMSGK